MDYKITNMGQGDENRFAAYELLPEPSDNNAAETLRRNLPYTETAPLNRAETAARNTQPTSVEDAAIAMMPANLRLGNAWASSLLEDTSLSPRIRDAAKSLLLHFERDTVDFIKTLPGNTEGKITKFLALHTTIVQVQDASAWVGLWHRVQQMPWYVQPALMHRLAKRLPCSRMSSAESTVLTNDFARWHADVTPHCIAHGATLLLSRSHATVIEALSHLSTFNSRSAVRSIHRHIDAAFTQTPVYARAEILDVLVNLDLAKLGPRSEILTLRVPSSVYFLLWDPLSKATCPSESFAEVLCDTAIDIWHFLPDKGDNLDDKIAAFCKRFDLGAARATALRSRLSINGELSRHPHPSITMAQFVNQADSASPVSAIDRIKAKL